MPEIYPDTENVRTVLAILGGSYKLDSSYSLSLSQNLLSLHREKSSQTEFTDPKLALNHSKSLEQNLRLSSQIAMRPGVSEASARNQLQASASGLTSLAYSKDVMVYSAFGQYSRYFYKYSRNKSGAANGSYLISGGLKAALQVDKLGVSVSTSRLLSVSHGEDGVSSYLNEVDASFQWSENLSLLAGLATSENDYELGTETNEYTLYKINKTQAYVGFVWSR